MGTHISQTVEMATMVGTAAPLEQPSSPLALPPLLQHARTVEEKVDEVAGAVPGAGQVLVVVVDASLAKCPTEVLERVVEHTAYRRRE